MVIIMYNARCGRDYCDAKMVMSAADAMVTNGMKEMGYEYIIISGTVSINTIMHCGVVYLCTAHRLLG